jgi:cysteine desulfurase
MKLPVYLDSSATTPCDPGVVEAMMPFFSTSFGNPASRSHLYGWEADEAVDTARAGIARMIGAKPTEIFFTSGATESCNLAIKGIFESFAGNCRHIITLSTEHKAVLETIWVLERKGCNITVLPVNKMGMPDLEEIERAIRPSTILIAAMAANNETGVILPLKEIAAIAKTHQVLFFSDATQAVGRMPVDMSASGIDMMAFTAHKMYGPKGVGALYIRSKKPAIPIKVQISGGNHERGIRSGTLNVPGIVGFGAAARIWEKNMATDIPRLLSQRIKLEKALLGIPDVYLNGDPDNRLPHVTNISIGGVESEQLLLYLSSKLALSSGAACSSATHEPSHVLKAMDVSAGLLHSTLRLSQGRYTTKDHIDFAIEELRNAIVRLREDRSIASSIRPQPSSFSALLE